MVKIPGFGPDNPTQVALQQPLDPLHNRMNVPVVAAPSQQSGQKQASLFASMKPQAPAPPQHSQPCEDSGKPFVGAPTYKVTLEIESFPTSIEAWYHDVMRNEQTLILVYDTRHTGSSRTRLRPQPADIAIHVEGGAVFYICTDPSISFVYEGNEFTVFLIKQEHPFAAEQF
jgi:hypothetical protein